MRLHFPYLVPGLLLVLILVGCGQGEPRSPSQALAAVNQALVSAAEAKQEDYRSAARHYLMAGEMLDHLLERWPDSEEAARLVDGEALVGGVRLAEFRQRVLPVALRLAELQEARDLFAVAEALTENIPSPNLRAETRNGLKQWMLFAGLSELVGQAGEEASGEFRESQALFDAVMARAREGDVSEAVDRLRNRVEPEMHASRLLSVSNALAAEGDTEAALEVLEIALRDMSPEQEILYSGAIAISYGMAGDYDRAVARAHSTRQIMQRIDAMLELSLMLSEEQDMARALETAQWAYEVTPLLNWEPTRIEYLATAARAAALAGDDALAAEMFGEAREVADEILSSRIRTESRGIIALEMASAGEKQQARALLEAAEREGLDDGARPEHLRRELRSFEVHARLGDYAAAFEELNRVNTLALLLDAIPAVAAAHARREDQPSHAQMYRLLRHVERWILPPGVYLEDD